MKKKLLDLSTKIDQRNIATFGEISNVAEKLGIPFVVVGATARDLILHHVYGARIQRATVDIDFGIQVSTWEEFDNLKKALCEVGYREDKQAQRLIDPRDRVVDLVPFGPLQDASAVISFPPKGDFQMSVLGFQEAMDHSIRVKVQKEPYVEVSVVSPQGLILLKIIAWADRALDKRSKDAADITYLLEVYERVGDISERAYDVEGLMESVDWDVTLASAYLLGQDATAIARKETRSMVSRILGQALDENEPSNLIVEMHGRDGTDIDNKFKLLAAFERGFTGTG